MTPELIFQQFKNLFFNNCNKIVLSTINFYLNDATYFNKAIIRNFKNAIK